MSKKETMSLGQVLKQKLAAQAEQEAAEPKISKNAYSVEDIRRLIFDIQDNLNKNLHHMGVVCDLVSGEMTLKFMDLYSDHPVSSTRITIRASFDTLVSNKGCYLTMILDVKGSEVTVQLDAYHPTVEDAGLQEILVELLNTLIQDCIPE